MTTPAAAASAAPRKAARATSTALLIAVLAASAAAVALWAGGYRWFVVETPSMAEAAPVGTLVVTAPTASTRVGDVIAFRPPGLDRVYTHRVVQVLPDGAVRTRGDLNGAEDAWTTPADRVVGEAVLLLPAAGFVARALPLLIGGALLLWWTTGLIRRPDRRAAVRVAGLHLLASVVLLFLHPLASIDLVATEAVQDGVRGSVVSTGLLPVRLLSPSGDPLAHLHDGQLAVVPLEPSASGRLLVSAVLDLPWTQHALLIGLALLPAVLLVVIGLPAARPRSSGVDAVVPQAGR